MTTHPASRFVVAATVALALATGCSDDDPETIRIDFSQGTQGWVAGFADYPAGEEDFFELEADYRALPAPLDTSQNAHYISGNNHSDDLWMYYKGQVLVPLTDTRYRVRFDVEIATMVPNGCFGVGGSPGEGVTMKAGASEIEPKSMLAGADLRMNVDKGNQTQGGEDAVVIGDVANSVPCGEPPRWELKRLSSEGDAIEVESDGAGRVWLFVGSDSGFEATTSLYYTWVVATFEPL